MSSPSKEVRFLSWNATLKLLNAYQDAKLARCLKPNDMKKPDMRLFDEDDHLVTVGFFIKFWEIYFLENLICERKLRIQFARYGNPDIVMSGNYLT